MVRIKVEYFVPLSHLFKKKEETFHFDAQDPPTIDAVLSRITAEYAGKLGKFPLRLRETSQSVILLNANKVSAYDTELADGDVLRIMVPLAGG